MELNSGILKKFGEKFRNFSRRVGW